jgi:DNA-binding IscR family transcriptional regulator
MLAFPIQNAVLMIYQLAEQQALGEDCKPLRNLDLAFNQGISLALVNSLLKSLLEGNLIKKAKGNRGYYLLAVPAQDITVADVALAIQKNVINRTNGLNKLNSALNSKVVGLLEGLTLTEIMADD